jgi:hypothetical protein
MLLASAATGVRKRNVAGFPAIRTIVQTVRGQTNVVLTFADGAVFLASTALFRLVAHRADDGTGHGSLQGKLYLTSGRAARQAFEGGVDLPTGLAHNTKAHFSRKSALL